MEPTLKTTSTSGLLDKEEEDEVVVSWEISSLRLLRRSVCG